MKKENRRLGRAKSCTRDWSMCGGGWHRDGIDNCIDDILSENDGIQYERSGTMNVWMFHYLSESNRMGLWRPMVQELGDDGRA
jgi:hypothetical protein